MNSKNSNTIIFHSKIKSDFDVKKCSSHLKEHVSVHVHHSTNFIFFFFTIFFFVSMERFKKKTQKEYTQIPHNLRIDRDLNWQLDSQEDNENNFFIIKNLKKGICGTVCQIVHLPSMRLFAGKQINENKLNEYQKKDLDKQINQLKSIISTYTTRVYGTIHYDGSIIIITEYCDRGSLRDFLDYHQKVLSEDQIAVIMKDVIRGLLLVHQKYNIVHSDIKASNILLTSAGFVKITDINLSTLFEYSQAKSPFWSSPESLSQTKFEPASDVWSIGATCIELSEGSPPYIEFPITNAISKITKNGFPGFRYENHSPEFVDFVNKCMIMDPSKRPNLCQLLDHPFIKKADILPRKIVLYDLLKPRKDIFPPKVLYENVEKPPDNSLYHFTRSSSQSRFFSDSDSDSSPLSYHNNNNNDPILDQNNNNNNNRIIAKRPKPHSFHNHLPRMVSMSPSREIQQQKQIENAELFEPLNFLPRASSSTMNLSALLKGQGPSTFNSLLSQNPSSSQSHHSISHNIPTYFVPEDDDSEIEEEINKYPPKQILEKSDISDYIDNCIKLAENIKFTPFVISRFPPININAIYEDFEEDENNKEKDPPVIINGHFNYRALLTHKEAPKILGWIYIVIICCIFGWKGIPIIIIVSLVIFFCSSILLPDLFPIGEND